MNEKVSFAGRLANYTYINQIKRYQGFSVAEEILKLANGKK